MTPLLAARPSLWSLRAHRAGSMATVLAFCVPCSSPITTQVAVNCPAFWRHGHRPLPLGVPASPGQALDWSHEDSEPLQTLGSRQSCQDPQWRLRPPFQPCQPGRRARATTRGTRHHVAEHPRLGLCVAGISEGAPRRAGPGGREGGGLSECLGSESQQARMWPLREPPA